MHFISNITIFVTTFVTILSQLKLLLLLFKKILIQQSRISQIVIMDLVATDISQGMF